MGLVIHLTDIRFPNASAFFGYVQNPNTGAVRPITALSVKEQLGAHGFPTASASRWRRRRRTTSGST